MFCPNLKLNVELPAVIKQSPLAAINENVFLFPIDKVLDNL